ncbi:MAG: 4Fe-4S binding protein [Bacillota bacterium]
MSNNQNQSGCGFSEKSKKKALTLLIAIIILAAWGQNFFKPGIDLSGHINEIFPGAPATKIISSNPVIYQVSKSQGNGEVLGYVVLESGQGYSGSLKVIVATDSEGRIIAARVVEHKEWPAWFEILSSGGYYKQFLGKSVTDPLRLSHDVEAVTGATYSSRGVTEAVRRGSHAVAEVKFGVRIKEEDEKNIQVGIREVSLFLIWPAVILLEKFRKHRFRWLTLAGGIIVIGYWLKSPVTLSGLVGLSLGFLPPLEEYLIWYIMMVTVLGTTALLGRNIYCVWMCPFGGIQELLALAGSGKVLAAGRLEKALQFCKHTLFWLALAAALITGVPSMGSYEPFGTAFSFKGNNIQWALLAAVMVMSLMVYRFWCRYACPVKVVLDAIAGLKRKVNKYTGFIRIKRNTLSAKKPSDMAGNISGDLD